MINETVDVVIEQELEKEGKTKKRKKILVGVIAGFSAAIIAVMSIIPFGKRKNSNDNTNTNTISTSSIDLSDLGNELDTETTTTTTYKVVSGDIDPNKIVEQDDKLYVDKENASKAKNPTTSIDLKNDTLETSSGKVYDKTTGYEIVDKETGKTVSSGNLDESGIPDGYAYDSVLNKIVPKEEVGKYVYADATYYDVEGNIVLKKGDVVAKETLDKAKKYFSTTKPIINESTTSKNSSTPVSSTTSTPVSSTTSTTSTTSAPVSSTTSTTSNEGVVNKDGTYTIFGLTFQSKADYQQWVLQGYEGYVEADGIMISEEELNNRLQKTK